VVVTYGRGSCPRGYLPAYSVNTDEEAKELIARVCEQVWIREDGGRFGWVAQELFEEQTLENLDAFGRRLDAAYQRMLTEREELKHEVQHQRKEQAMAKEKKPKTKKVPFDREATEVAGRMNVWEWECGGRRWRWSPAKGLNLELMVDEGQWQLVGYLPDLKSAGYFVEGVSLGMRIAERELENQQEEDDAEDAEEVEDVEDEAVDSPSHEKLP
jgi:hypothetical protein